MLKPLKTEKNRESKQRRGIIILGIIIAVIMIFGSVGWALVSQKDGSEKVEYNGFTFLKQDNRWFTEVEVYGEKQTVTSLYHPGQLNETDVKIDIGIEKFAGKDLYVIALSPEEQQAAIELVYNLGNFVNRAQFACLPTQINDSFCDDKPVKDCGDVDFNSAIILINTEIDNTEYKEGCLKIKGEKEDFVKITDKIIFQIFNII